MQSEMGEPETNKKKKKEGKESKHIHVDKNNETNRETDKQTDKQTDRETDGHTKGQTDIPISKHTDR